MAVAVDPVEQLREQIEVIAARSDLTSDEKRAKLHALKVKLTEALGLVAGYLLDEDRVEEGLRIQDYEMEQRLRSNATLAEEIVERGVATWEQMHDQGYFSHVELDALEADDRLTEAIDWAERLHPRDRTGKWRDKFGSALKANLRSPRPPAEPLVPRTRSAKPAPKAAKPKPPKDEFKDALDKVNALKGPAQKFSLPDGSYIIRTEDGGFQAYRKQSAHRAAVTNHNDPVEALRAAGMRAPGDSEPRERPADRYTQRKEALEQRAAEQTREGLKRAKLTDAEQHFNDAGKVSQRELGKYVDTAATRPHTVDLYSEMRGGKRVWDESRRELHEKIIDRFLRQRVFDPAADGGKGGWMLSDDAPPFTPSETPQVLFSGGGYAAGKSSVLKINRAQGGEPPSGYDGPVLVLDPDAIKAELPEFQELLGSDPEANMTVYQEAWAIAQEIQARAQEQKLNMVVDGISNTSPEEMIERVRSFLDRGYTAKAVYVDIPTEEALKRAGERARKAESPGDRRHIPEIIMRSVHRDVASTVPNMVRRLAADGVKLDVEVWSNHEGQDESGGFRPPLRFFSYVDGVETVDDEPRWRAFQDKAFEKILSVEGPES